VASDADFYGRICIDPFELPIPEKIALWHNDTCINGPLAKGLRVAGFNRWNFAPAVGGNWDQNRACNILHTISGASDYSPG